MPRQMKMAIAVSSLELRRCAEEVRSISFGMDVFSLCWQGQLCTAHILYSIPQPQRDL